MSARLVSATRRLAHLLLERTVAGSPTDTETAGRLVDARLVPTPEGRKRVAGEALALCRAAVSHLSREDWLASELHTNMRVALRDRQGAPFSVVVPSVVVRADGTASVLVMAPAGDRGADARARRYRFAVGRLQGRRAQAFVVRPDGTLDKLPARHRGPKAVESRR